MGNIFQNDVEIQRLALQNRLLKPCEQPVYQRVMAGREGLRLLDLGCSSGDKTADRFAGDSVAQVIGLEYNSALVQRAQGTYGGDRFFFFQCDAEAPDFPLRLRQVMEERGIAAFDIIHISFVLLHLKNPRALLESLHQFLAPQGQLVLVETNDPASSLSPDPDRLFQTFLELLAQDPLSGDRAFGLKLPALLEQSGYGQIQLETRTIQGGPLERQTKEDIFEIFFSYLPQDIALLREQSRDYDSCAAWLEQNYEPLHRLILADGSQISVGLSMAVCREVEA